MGKCVSKQIEEPATVEGTVKENQETQNGKATEVVMENQENYDAKATEVAIENKEADAGKTAEVETKVNSPQEVYEAKEAVLDKPEIMVSPPVGSTENVDEQMQTNDHLKGDGTLLAKPDYKTEQDLPPAKQHDHSNVVANNQVEVVPKQQDGSGDGGIVFKGKLYQKKVFDDVLGDYVYLADESQQPEEVIQVV